MRIQGGGGGRDPPALDHQFFFSTNFLTIAKKDYIYPYLYIYTIPQYSERIYRSEYSMDAMYLNLMFINPRPRRRRGRRTRCTRPSLTPPPPPLQKILDPRLYCNVVPELICAQFFSCRICVAVVAPICNKATNGQP